jgi:hypothetical protein
MATNRKGAVEISMGFIITIVIAVVFLSLVLSWLSGMTGQVGELTHKVTDVARTELINKIAQTGATVGIAAPPVTNWKRGETGSFAVGITNKYADQSKTFRMNVYLQELGGSLAGTPASTLDVETQGWLTYTKDVFVEPGASASVDVIMKPSAGATTGIYLFRVAICETSTVCSLQSPDIYGSESFAIEIEAF